MSEPTYREALPAVLEKRSTVVQDGIAMDAVLQLAYHEGEVSIGIGGGHDTVYRSRWGRSGHADGTWETVREALIAAGEAVRRPGADTNQREGNES